MTPVTVGIVPKSIRNPYFQDCHRGAREAATELGFELRWDGPERADAAHQARLVAQWTQEGIPVLAVSVESSSHLTPALKAARVNGTKVLTWDSDAAADARDFTIVHATSESVAHALAFEIVRILGGGVGSVAAVTSTLSCPNQKAWIAAFTTRLAKDYPGLRLAEVRACNDSEDQARLETLDLLRRHPDLKAIVGFCSPAVPGAAEALKEAGRGDIRVTGVSLPSVCRRHIEEGVVDSVVIWKTRNLGYLVGASAHALATGSLCSGATLFRAGRLGNLVVLNDEIRLGRCHIVTRGNIAEFD
jgi:ABC-type sugar transport system substrate-binding protein